MKTLKNNITKLVKAGIISVNLPTMGGVLVVKCASTEVEFDIRNYYEGRGAKYNKTINHEKVIVKITRKELATAMRHFKARNKKRLLVIEALIKQETKGEGNYHWRVPLKHYMTKASKLYFPEMKELSRTKI